MEPPVVAIEGEVGTGKTSFALTFPKPIMHLDTDVGGFQRASWRFKDEIASGGIKSKTYHYPDRPSAKDLLRSISGKGSSANRMVGALDVWNALFDDYGEALDNKSISTIVFDSWTRVWRLCTAAFLEERRDKGMNVGGLMERDYGEPNNRMTSILDIGRKYGKCIVLVCHLDDERKDYLDDKGQRQSMVTGKRIADQWRRTSQLVDMVIRTELNSNKPKATITQSKLVLDLTGIAYEEPSWTMVETAVRMLRGES